MCVKLFFVDLDYGSYPPHLISTCTCRVTVAPKICGGCYYYYAKRLFIYLLINVKKNIVLHTYGWVFNPTIRCLFLFFFFSWIDELGWVGFCTFYWILGCVCAINIFKSICILNFFLIDLFWHFEIFSFYEIEILYPIV